MSGGTAPPKLDNAQDAGKFYGNLMKGGLPTDLRNRLQSQLQGNIQAGEMALGDTFAGKNLSAGAIGGAMTQLRNQVGAAGNLGLAEQDFNARLQGAGGRLNVAGLNNQSEMARYQTEKANEFSWGDALGAALGAGGSVGGAAMMKPK